MAPFLQKISMHVHILSAGSFSIADALWDITLTDSAFRAPASYDSNIHHG